MSGALPDVDRTAIFAEQSWYRHISSRHPDPLGPVHLPAGLAGRWQQSDVVGALYLADSLPTMWAEWYRHLAEVGLPPNDWLPRDVYRYMFRLDGVADLGSAARLRRAGLTYPPLPSKGSWPASQVVGHDLYRAGHPALTAVSAALLRGRVLCVFLPVTPAPNGGHDITPAPTGRIVGRRFHYRPPGLLGVALVGQQLEPPPVPKGLRT